MYALTVTEGVSKKKLPQLMLNLIYDLNLKKIDVICKEVFNIPWSYDFFFLPRDKKKLLYGLEFLSEDLGFFTLSCKNQALIVPFEGANFNIIIPTHVRLPVYADLDHVNATDVLNQYREAYDGFGLTRTFVSAESIMH